jgi:hypothetical protein
MPFEAIFAPMQTALDAALKKKLDDDKRKEQEDAALLEKNRAMAFNDKPETTDNTAMMRRYDTIRSRAKSDVSQATGEQQDALKRRFAQLGNLSSGAAMKQEQITGQKGAELQQRATEGIDIAQEQEQQALEEQTKQRNFAKSERIGSQAFASVESQLGRNQQDRQFNASQQLAASQFAQQMAQAAKAFDLEKTIQEFNMKMARDASNEKPWYDSWSLSNIMKNTFNSQQNSSAPANQKTETDRRRESPSRNY